MPAKYLVLYADDDSDDLMLVKEAFQEYSSVLNIVTVDDGTKVIDFLISTQELPCLIILDVNMPKMGGKETLAEIKKVEHLKDIPVIFFTTSSRPFKSAIESSVPFITKPTDMEQYSVIPTTFLSNCSEHIKIDIENRMKVSC